MRSLMEMTIFRPASFPRTDRDAAWSKDAIGLAVVVAVVLAVIVCCVLRNICIARRLHAEDRDLRLERRGRVEEARKERAREVEAALVAKTASKCNCSSDQVFDVTKCFSASEITLRTNVTDDTSVCSSEGDVENPAETGDKNDDESSSGQICAICLEPYLAGRDSVSWSRVQTCRHAFHQKCILSWLEQSKNAGNCPCCRGPFLKEEEQGRSEEIEATPNDENDRRNEAGVEEESQRVVRTEQGRDSTRERDGADDIPNPGGQNEERPSNSNAQTLDEGVPVADRGVVNLVLDANSPSSKSNSVARGSEFTSFCVVHGLIRDNSIKPFDEPTGPGSNV